MYYRIRIRNVDGTHDVLDFAFSQVCALIKELSEADKDKFWNGKESVDLPNGENVKFMYEV